MREDQMSKLDRGLVTFSAVGARGVGGGWGQTHPDFDRPGNPIPDDAHHITTPQNFQTFLWPCHICLLGHGMPLGDIQYTSRHEYRNSSNRTVSIRTDF